MILHLPYPPSANHLYLRNRNGSSRLNPTVEAFRWKVKEIVRPSFETLTGALDVTIGIFAPDKRRRDIDNVVKATFDALTHAGVWEDDRQVFRLLVVRQGERIKEGRLTVTITDSGSLAGGVET